MPNWLWSLMLACLLGLPSVTGAFAQDRSRYPIIPWPQHLEARVGEFVLDPQTRIALYDPSNAELQHIAGFLAEMVRLSTGWPLPVVGMQAGSPDASTISLVLEEGQAARGAESYALSVTPNAVTISAGTPAGLFYGAQTLRQLLPVAVERGGKAGEVEAWAIPAVGIEDAPRFSYRGMHLDVGRHFFPVAFIKKYIDLLALYKMNTFHWHLTEDQGWRIEIKQYPKLAEVGGCREETLVGHYSNQPHQFDGERNCGYFTQDEILEGGLAPGATVMSWRGTQGGIGAARQGHDVIMTPNDDLYFDHYQGGPATEPLAIGGLTTLEDVYHYEPISQELTAEESRHVLGAQANVWTEYMPTSQKVEYMVFPRMLALAEVGWTPGAARGWERFTERIPVHLERLDMLNVHYRRSEW